MALNYSTSSGNWINLKLKCKKIRQDTALHHQINITFTCYTQIKIQTRLIMSIRISFNSLAWQIRVQHGFYGLVHVQWVSLLSFHKPLSPLWVFPQQLHTPYITPSTATLLLTSSASDGSNCMLSNNNHLIRVTVIESCYHCWFNFITLLHWFAIAIKH